VAIQNKHQEKSEATRAKLFRAALRVFSRDGFEAARIEDIAAKAGFTRGAFYAHFPSKEDLFFALLEDELRKRSDSMLRALKQAPTPEARLDTFREYYVTHASDQAWVLLILEFKLYAFRHRNIRARLVRRFRDLRERIRWEGPQELWPETMSSDKPLLIAALSGMVLQRAYDPDSLSEADLDSLLRRLFDLLRPH